MMLEIHRARFLKASDLLNELLLLQRIKSVGQFVAAPSLVDGMTPAMDQRQVQRLKDLGWVEQSAAHGETVLRLSAAGEQQLRVLMVDYMRELMLLHGEMIGVFRGRLAEFYLAGVRRVAFYPIGDTAEVVYLALKASGISLELAVDDDPMLWGSMFHDVPVKSPVALTNAQIDGVLLTTSVFEEAIRERLSEAGKTHLKLLSLW